MNNFTANRTIYAIMFGGTKIENLCKMKYFIGTCKHIIVENEKKKNFSLLFFIHCTQHFCTFALLFYLLLLFLGTTAQVSANCIKCLFICVFIASSLPGIIIYQLLNSFVSYLKVIKQLQLATLSKFTYYYLVKNLLMLFFVFVL